VRAVSPSFELNFLGTIVGIIAAAGLIGAAERAGKAGSAGGTPSSRADDATATR
jgi:hypothetical protein